MASLQGVCRICEDQSNLYDFTVQANAAAAEKLATLTSIRIRADDSLPRHICGTCYRKLHNAYNFLQRCEVAEQRWQEKTISVFEQKSVDTEEGQQSLNGMVPSTHSTMENLAESEMHMVEDRKDMVLGKTKQTPTHENGTNFICKFCERSFENAMELFKHHALTHTKGPKGRSKPKEQNFLCQDCHKSFTTKASLKLHVRTIHNGEKRFVCTLCRKAFSQKAHLEEHHNTHVLEKNFPCEICETRYKSRRLLKAHLVHHSERVKCDICHKLLSTNQTLNMHKRLHTGKKPFGCTVCGKAFVLKVRLTYHMKQVHGNLENALEKR